MLRSTYTSRGIYPECTYLPFPFYKLTLVHISRPIPRSRLTHAISLQVLIPCVMPMMEYLECHDINFNFKGNAIPLQQFQFKLFPKPWHNAEFPRCPKHY
jgi:hypothetical protein